MNNNLLLNERETKFYAEAIKASVQTTKLGNRAGTTADPKDAFNNFRVNMFGDSILQAVPVHGIYKNIYEKASTEVIPQYIPKDIAPTLESIKAMLKVTNEEGIERHVVISRELEANSAKVLKFDKQEIKSEKLINLYGSVTRAFCAKWGVSFVGASRVTELYKDYVNYSLRLAFKVEDIGFFIDVPAVKSTGEFERNGNSYVFQNTCSNLEAYLERKADVLFLVHPIEFLLETCTTAFINYKTWEPVHYSPEQFRKNINFASNNRKNPGYSKPFHDNINNTLRNAKEFSWIESRPTPIIWVDKQIAAGSKQLLCDSISAFITYEMLDKEVCDWRGLDLLSGSVSKPGSRVSLSMGYEKKSIAVGGGYKLALVPTCDRQESELTESEKYISSFKAQFPGTAKTSCKRHNESPAGNTGNYLNNEYSYVSRVGIVSK